MICRQKIGGRKHRPRQTDLPVSSLLHFIQPTRIKRTMQQRRRICNVTQPGQHRRNKSGIPRQQTAMT